MKAQSVRLLKALLPDLEEAAAVVIQAVLKDELGERVATPVDDEETIRRRERDRLRKRSQRNVPRVSADMSHVSDDVPSVSHSAVPPQKSPSLVLSPSHSPLQNHSDSETSERESSSLGTREDSGTNVRVPRAVPSSCPTQDVPRSDPPSVTGIRTVVQDGPERYVALDDAITPELESIAQLAAVQDIPGAWLKFCGHLAGKWVHVAGKWQLWCVKEAKHERVERERQKTGTRLRTARADENYTPPPVSRHEKPEMARADFERLGVPLATVGIAEDAPMEGTAKTHPRKRAS